jgi:uncharacterized SAM-binding protein YcdF (DUF218 family)
MIYLRQILPLFLLPVGMTLILVLVGMLRRRRVLVALGLAVLWVSSTPLLSDLLARALEGRAERGLPADAPAADAIVVLSGGRLLAPGPAGISEWRDPDRFFGGVELFRAGKAPLLVFTGGWVPWESRGALEGDILAGYARAMGVGVDSVVTTGRVSNTEEEARAVAALLRERRKERLDSGTWTRVLLVTSAFHMPRAKILFERVGLTVLPFPVDFQVPEARGFSVMALLPAAGALKLTELGWREMYGRLFYLVARR